jgi:hypothetical protein
MERILVDVGEDDGRTREGERARAREPSPIPELAPVTSAT